MIDQVVYINLDHRTDRREQIEKELLKIPCQNVRRFSAIRHPHGDLGCSKSHIEVLKLAIQSGWKNVLILEDDMVFREEKWDLLYEKMTSYDAIVLGGMLPEYNNDSLKLTKCYGTGAYIVNSSYYKTLLANFEEGAKKLELSYYPKKQFLWSRPTPKYAPAYTLDQYWNSLQQKDNWFLVQMMYSPPSYSDITEFIEDYTDRFTIT
jgi:GR25 family glycosyltransferase involved in LPS biosynthesis